MLELLLSGSALAIGVRCVVDGVIDRRPVGFTLATIAGAIVIHLAAYGAARLAGLT